MVLGWSSQRPIRQLLRLPRSTRHSGAPSRRALQPGFQPGFYDAPPAGCLLTSSSRGQRAGRPARGPASAPARQKGCSRREAGAACRAAACRALQEPPSSQLRSRRQRAGRPARGPASEPTRHDGLSWRMAGAACHPAPSRARRRRPTASSAAGVSAPADPLAARLLSQRATTADPGARPEQRAARRSAGRAGANRPGSPGAPSGHTAHPLCAQQPAGSPRTTKTEA